MTEPEVKPEDIISKLDSVDTSVPDGSIGWYPILQRNSEDEESIEDKENRGIIKMRNRWSNAILALIVMIVIFDMILVWLVGIRVWSFNNTSIVIAVIADNFLKIVGLGYLITTELFKKIFPRK
jgi:hypothetical protein